jgi:hypothetical protein
VISSVVRILPLQKRKKENEGDPKAIDIYIHIGEISEMTGGFLFSL